MKDMFAAEWMRFRLWAFVAAGVHVVALGFLSRLIDLAQQPMQVYQVFGIVYAVLGALLGLYQMGTYRRPNQWLNLMHRPLSSGRIATALCGAGTLVLLTAVAAPIALVAAYQETLSARVVDARHWLIPSMSLLIALCGYLAGAYAMLANKRYSWAVFVLPTLLLWTQAHGIGMLAIAALVLSYLATLLGAAFKPDLGGLPRSAVARVAAALPVQVGVYLLLLVLSVGYELVWTMTGTHPLNQPRPPAGGFIEADRAEGAGLMLAGIAGSRDPDASLWREQIALSEVFELHTFRELPVANSLGNMMPMEFDDEKRNIRWVFSHDRMRFVGYSLLDRRERGELGLGPANAAFPEPVLPLDYMIGPTGVYQYDEERGQVVQRAWLPEGEVLASAPRQAGDNIVVLSDRAAYFYSGRDMANGFGPLQPLLRVPLPGPSGKLSRVDLIELLDGYLISATYTWGAWSGRALPRQQVLHVDGSGRVRTVANRQLAFDLPVTYSYRDWWISPPLHAACAALTNLFAVPNPLNDSTTTPVPRRIVLLACVLGVLSMLGAVWLSGHQRQTGPARWAWVLACAVVGMPALLALWLLHPAGGSVAHLPLAEPASA